MAFTERSRTSREALLAAARATFGESGFERTTVRAVAAAAGVDPSMVARYFGGKDGLFAAAVDVDLRLPNLAAVLPAERAEVLARHFVEIWEESGTGDALRILLRASTTHEIAAGQVRQVFADQVVRLVASLDAGTEADVARRAGRISTLVLGTALTRYVLRLPPVADLGVEELVEDLAAALRGPLGG